MLYICVYVCEQCVHIYIHSEIQKRRLPVYYGRAHEFGRTRKKRNCYMFCIWGRIPVML